MLVTGLVHIAFLHILVRVLVLIKRGALAVAHLAAAHPVLQGCHV